MIFWLGLLLAVCSIPGYTSAMIPGQWAVLSIVLPLGLWRSGHFGPGHIIGLLCLAWAAFSVLWAPFKADALFGLWIMFVWAGAFWLGATTTDLRPLWKGLAVGLTVSSVVAIWQWYGFDSIRSFSAITAGGMPAGLLYNSTVLGAVDALVLIALLQNGLWLWAIGLLPGLYLCHCRGAWFAILVAFFANRVPVVACALLTSIAIYFAYSTSSSDIQRMVIWAITASQFNLSGYGVGSFVNLLYFNTAEIYQHSTGVFRPEFVHNDYLQLWFELGVGAIGFYALYAIVLWHSNHTEWPIFVAFAAIGLFWFPLYHPLTAFIGCVVAGRIVAYWHSTRALGYYWRPDRLLWYPTSRSSGSGFGQEYIPVVSHNPNAKA